MAPRQVYHHAAAPYPCAYATCPPQHVDSGDADLLLLLRRTAYFGAILGPTYMNTVEYIYVVLVDLRGLTDRIFAA
jgi:hypothetical protein